MVITHAKIVPDEFGFLVSQFAAKEIDMDNILLVYLILAILGLILVLIALPTMLEKRRKKKR